MCIGLADVRYPFWWNLFLREDRAHGASVDAETAGYTSRRVDEKHLPVLVKAVNGIDGTNTHTGPIFYANTRLGDYARTF